MTENQYNQNFKLISPEEFKKLDINTISYVQLYTGEILMIDHPYFHNLEQSKINNQEKNDNIIQNQKEISENKQHKKKRKRRKKKNKNKNNEESSLLKSNNNKEKTNSNNDNDNYNFEQNYDNYLYGHNINDYNETEGKYIIPTDYYSSNNKMNRAYSAEIKNKGRILFNEEWKDMQDYDFRERMKFYDSIPKRAKYWERESFDATRSLFNSKRLSKNPYYNQEQNMINYKPIPQESYSSSSEDQKEKYEEIQNNDEYNNNYEYPFNQLVSNQKDLYNLALGPLFSQYMLGQQNNNQIDEYDEGYWQNNDDSNYYETNQYNYNNYNQNNYDYYSSNFYNSGQNGYQTIKGRKNKKIKKKLK